MSKKPRPPTMRERLAADRAADAERRPYVAIAFARALVLSGALVGMIAAFAFGLSLILGAAGCAALPFAERDVPQFAPDGTNSVPRAALVVTLTHVNPKRWGGWDGAEPATVEDSRAVRAALEARGIPYLCLSNEAATVRGVLGAAEAVGRRVGEGGLIMLYFSGHGSQWSGETETDGLDETLCLWDGALSDNIVWQMLERVPEGVRVWMVTDCCHSGSNYRAPPPPHDYARGARSKRSWFSSREPSLLHWGASTDATVAYGYPGYGGWFTYVLRKVYRPGMTYREWFEAARPSVQKKQTPSMSHTGEDFSNMEAWK